MITINFIRKNNKIVGFNAHGHSKYDEFGKDIICASISAMSQQVVAGITEYLKINAKFKIADEGYLSIDLRETDYLEKEKEVSTLFESFYIMIREIEKEYPKYVKLINKEV